MGAFDPSSTSRAVRSCWGVCEGGGAPAWPGAAFWWCLFREHGLASVWVCVCVCVCVERERETETEPIDDADDD